MTTNEKLYADYLSYINRNDPSRVPMTFAEFCEYNELNDAPKPVVLSGIYDPANY